MKTKLSVLIKNNPDINIVEEGCLKMHHCKGQTIEKGKLIPEDYKVYCGYTYLIGDWLVRSEDEGTIASLRKREGLSSDLDARTVYILAR